MVIYQRRSHITHTTQGDGDGIGIVDAHGYHRERYHQTDDEISGEEGKQRNTLLHRYVHTINLQWQQGNGEEHDSQTAYPLGERTPEEQSVGETFYIVLYRGSHCRKSRHGFKVVDVSTYHEGEPYAVLVAYGIP